MLRAVPAASSEAEIRLKISTGLSLSPVSGNAVSESVSLVSPSLSDVSLSLSDVSPLSGVEGGSVSSAATVTVTSFEVDGLNAEGSVGVNTAVTELVPTGKVSIPSVATPVSASVAAVPSESVPLKNSTEPATAGLTVAVKVTESPSVTDDKSTVKVVVVSVGATIAYAEP